MDRALLQPLLQHLSHYLADRLPLLPAANSHFPNQSSGQVDSEDSFGFWHGPQLEMILGFQQIAISLAA